MVAMRHGFNDWLTAVNAVIWQQVFEAHAVIVKSASLLGHIVFHSA